LWAQKRAFVHVINNVCDIHLSQLSYPYIKEYMVFKQISKEIYLIGLEECKNHLQERILLIKRDKLLINLNLCNKLDVT